MRCPTEERSQSSIEAALTGRKTKNVLGAWKLTFCRAFKGLQQLISPEESSSHPLTPQLYSLHTRWVRGEVAQMIRCEYTK